MPDDLENLLHRLIGGDATAGAEILRHAATSGSPVLLVAAAMLADEPAPMLARAGTRALVTRDRQLVAIALARFEDDPDRLDALIRDHLADYPDDAVAAWIATNHLGSGRARSRQP